MCFIPKKNQINCGFEVGLIFTENYPDAAPLCRLLSPSIELRITHWSPAILIKDVLIAIQHELQLVHSELAILVDMESAKNLIERQVSEQNISIRHNFSESIDCNATLGVSFTIKKFFSFISLGIFQ